MITLPEGFSKWIQDESDAAKGIKQDSPVMVIMGNPPYAGNSKNNSDWIKNLLRGLDSTTKGLHPTENYFEVDGKPLGERNPKFLNDDYVKFIRFGQWRIEQTGYGVLAFVTNHGYLDNPTFRGMRESLLKTFDDIYILDLHGNSKKKERCPDGSKDENVFDIQQGAAISIFVKTPNSNKEQATVHHAHLWGLREEHTGEGKNKELIGGKYHWLEEYDIETTEFQELKPQSPHYLFIPQDTKLLAEYERGWKVTDIMAVNVLGFQTHRDRFAIDFERESLFNKISSLYKDELTDEELRDKFNLKKWNIRKARTDLRSNKNWETAFTQCSYRPFDKRECYFSNIVMDRPRRELKDHVFDKENLCLNTVRQTKNNSWQHSVVSNAPTPAVFVEMKDGSNVFPLYLYPTEKEATLFDLEENFNTPRNRRPNLSAEFITDFAQHLKLEFIPDGKGDRETTFAPEDIFAYMYAVFHSPTYRDRYAEFLKTDFPRLPLTSQTKLFKQLANIGDLLIELHLMENYGAELTNYPVEGDNKVDKIRYDPPQPPFFKLPCTHKLILREFPAPENRFKSPESMN